MKKVTAMALALLCALSLAGCGSDGWYEPGSGASYYVEGQDELLVRLRELGAGEVLLSCLGQDELELLSGAEEIWLTRQCYRLDGEQPEMLGPDDYDSLSDGTLRADLTQIVSHSGADFDFLFFVTLPEVPGGARERSLKFQTGGSLFASIENTSCRAGYTVTEELDGGGESIHSWYSKPDIFEYATDENGCTVSFDLPRDSAAEHFYAVFTCEALLAMPSLVTNLNAHFEFSGGGQRLVCQALLQYVPVEDYTT